MTDRSVLRSAASLSALSLLAVSLAAVHSAPAWAWDPTLPQHPTTFPVNPGLTDGPVANMREMYADPYTLKDQLKPSRTFVPPKVKPKVVLTRDRFVISDKILFETGKAALLPASNELLDTIAAALKEHPGVLKVRVEGHTDDVGEDEYNQGLSERRALAVQQALVARNIAPERLEAVGKGETDPRVADTTDEARQANRRVEFMIAERAEREDEDPAVVQAALEDAADVRERLRAERRKLLALPKDGDLAIRNEFTSYADVTVGDVQVGRIGPLTTAVVKGVDAGFYDVTLTLQNGFSRTVEVRTVRLNRSPMPGGPEAREALEAGIVYSWHDRPERGHTPAAAPAE